MFSWWPVLFIAHQGRRGYLLGRIDVSAQSVAKRRAEPLPRLYEDLRRKASVYSGQYKSYVSRTGSRREAVEHNAYRMAHETRQEAVVLLAERRQSL